MDTKVSIQHAADDEDVPQPDKIRQWVAATLQPKNKDAEVCIRIVEPQESQTLNQTYRQKPYPTNVLAFPADVPAVVNSPLLGDIAICAAIVKQEAIDQKKSIEAHWCHMVVHGLLHLQGFDHVDDIKAKEMETLETQILKGLEYPAPYEPSDEQFDNTCRTITEAEGARQSE